MWRRFAHNNAVSAQLGGGCWRLCDPSVSRALTGKLRACNAYPRCCSVGGVGKCVLQPGRRVPRADEQAQTPGMALAGAEKCRLRL